MDIKKFIKYVVILVVAVGAIAGYMIMANAPTKYNALRAVRGNISGIVKESGNIHGIDKKEYYAAVSAPVSSILVEEGDVVKSGEHILSYDTNDLVHAATQASLSAKEAKESADGAIAQSDKYAGKYAKASADDAAYAMLYAYEREQGNAIDESQYAKDYQKACDYASVSKAIAAKQGEITAKQSELARYTDVYGGKLTDEYVSDGHGSSSFDKSSKDYKKYKELKNELDELNSEYASLQQSLAGFTETTYTPGEYEQLNDTKNVMEDITRNWTQAKSDKATAESAILNENQKAAMLSSAKRYSDNEVAASEELSKAKKGVDAEFGGVVTACDVKCGAYVTEGTPLFTVESNEKLMVELMISKYDIGEIEEGQSAVIKVAGKEYTGYVSKINHLATNDSSDKNKIKIEVAMDEPDEDVIIGVEADVTINTAQSNNAVLIPYGAYYSDEDGAYCFVVEEGVLAKRYFKAGIVNDSFVEVISGVSEGDLVIVDRVAEAGLGQKAEAKEQ